MTPTTALFFLSSAQHGHASPVWSPPPHVVQNTEPSLQAAFLLPLPSSAASTTDAEAPPSTSSVEVLLSNGSPPRDIERHTINCTIPWLVEGIGRFSIVKYGTVIA